VLADTLVCFKLPGSLQQRMDAMRRATADIPQLVERILSHKFRAEQPVTHLYTEINNFNLGVRENVRGSFGEGVTVERLAATEIPILFLVGSEDILFPPDFGEGDAPDDSAFKIC
jgi:3-oxoadipate enol-lactonase